MFCYVLWLGLNWMDVCLGLLLSEFRMHFAGEIVHELAADVY